MYAHDPRFEVIDDELELADGGGTSSTALMLCGTSTPGVASQFENSFLCDTCSRYQTLDKVLRALLSGVTSAALSGTAR